MEDFLASELETLGLDDATTFASFIASMLHDGDPWEAPERARELLDGAMEHLATLCDEAGLERADVRGANDRTWQQWLQCLPPAVEHW